MLFHVNTKLAHFYWCFHVFNEQMYKLGDIYHTNWCYTVTKLLANKIDSLIPVKCHLTAAMGIFCMGHVTGMVLLLIYHTGNIELQVLPLYNCF